MLPLAEMQRDFARAVRGEKEPGTGLSIRAADLAPERRISVYRNHHRISLAAALAANFPTVCKVIGDAAFRIVALDYVLASAPRQPCLSAYGEDFPTYLERDARIEWFPYLPDVARLDWALNVAERACDVASFGTTDLAVLAESGLAEISLSAHPSMSLVNSAYPLLRIRDLAQAPLTVGGVRLDEGAVTLMVWRKESAQTVAELDPESYKLLRLLKDGSAFGVATEGMGVEAVATALGRFVVCGAFVRPNKAEATPRPSQGAR